MEVLTILQEKGLLSAESVAELRTAVENGADLEKVCLDAGVNPAEVRNAFGTAYGVAPFVPTDGLRIPTEVLDRLSEDSAKHYLVVPISEEDSVLQVVVNDPENIQIREVLNFVTQQTGLTYKMLFGLKSDIRTLLGAYESLTGEIGEALGSIGEEEKKKNTTTNKSKVTREHIEEDAPVTKIVATILRYAVDGNASDIHIEPFQKSVRVRFRIDGELQTNLQLPLKVQQAVVARVKILASLRLDEKRKPQDGRFSATIDGRSIDFRVSVLPTNYGEKVVMRILDTSKGVRTLEDAGISSYNLDIIKKVVKEPYGIVLISGPTGSGKSTTLYSMLKEVDKETKNVLSLEDPVEYDIDGVSQSQMRPEIGYTFAAGLRSALRQDPDIIMVGEIRDKETAQLAIQAALTGHLVFSTIHTNNSIGVIPRLVDMGVDPYLIAPTLKLAIAQRLARRIYPGSGREMKVEGSLSEDISQAFATLPAKYRDRIPEANSVLYSEPSKESPSGTKGRIAITECLPITDEIEKLILNNGSEQEIYDAARKNGFLSMEEDAIIKALEHVIPFEEVNAFTAKVVDTEEDIEEMNEVLPEQPAVTATMSTSSETTVDNYDSEESLEL